LVKLFSVGWLERNVKKGMKKKFVIIHQKKLMQIG